jgi:hypothetical protein
MRWKNTARRFCVLTTPSLLSRVTLDGEATRFRAFVPLASKDETRDQEEHGREREGDFHPSTSEP